MLYARQDVTGEEIVAFVHIPKTAGTSIVHHLSQFIGREHACDLRGSPVKPHAFDLGRRRETRFVAGHFEYGIHIHFLRSPLYFTVVRNPIDRFLSWYRFIQRSTNHPLHSHIGRMSVEDAAHYSMDNDLAATNVKQCRAICRAPDFDVAKAFLDEKFFLACDLDQVESMMAALCQAYAPRRPMARLPRRNVSRNPVPAALGPQVRQRMEKNWADDFRLHAYVRDEFASLARDVIPEIATVGYRHYVAHRRSQMGGIAAPSSYA